MPHLPVLDLLLDRQADEASKNVEETLSLPDFFPKVRCLETVGIVGIPLTAVAPFVERKKEGAFSGQLCGHAHFVGIDGEMDQRPLLELKQRLPRVTILPVLLLGVSDILSRERVLEIRRGHRQSVHAEYNVDGESRCFLAEVNLTGDGKDVLLVERQCVRIHPRRRLEECQSQLDASVGDTVP